MLNESERYRVTTHGLHAEISFCNIYIVHVLLMHGVHNNSNVLFNM